MLVAHDSGGERVYCRDAIKGQPYTCPECGGELVVKQGKIKIWHYAHRTNLHNCSRAGETLYHLELKDFLYRKLKDQPWVTRCELEFPVPGINRRADVWAITVRNHVYAQIAFECQVSTPPLTELQEKITDYTSNGIHVAYIFHEKRFPKIDEHNEASIPTWIRELHLLHQERVYVYYPTRDQLCPVILRPPQQRFYFDEYYNQYMPCYFPKASIRHVIPLSALDLTRIDCEPVTLKKTRHGIRGRYLVAHFIT